MIPNDIIDENLKSELKNIMRESIKGRSESDYDRFIQIMNDTFEYSHLLTIFTNDGHTDLDEAILYSILKAKESKNSNESEELSILNRNIIFSLYINFKNFKRITSKAIESSFNMESY